eukprot:jgi/Picsp_1/6314/NSC_03663-R1_harpin binding protein 1
MASLTSSNSLTARATSRGNQCVHPRSLDIYNNILSRYPDKGMRMPISPVFQGVGEGCRRSSRLCCSYFADRKGPIAKIRGDRGDKSIFGRLQAASGEDIGGEKEPVEEQRNQVEKETGSTQAKKRSPKRKNSNARNKETTSVVKSATESVEQQGDLVEETAGIAVPEDERRAAVEELKARIVGLVVPLDRGSSGTIDDATRIRNAVVELEKISPRVVRLFEKNVENGMLAGRWRLLYSSEFVPGNVKYPGNSVKPGAGILAPIELGNVFQDIDPTEKTLDNVVELISKVSLASLLGGEVKSPSLVATLKHSYSILGARTIRIVFEATIVKPKGGLNNWLESIPEIITPDLLSMLDDSFRSAAFDVIYLDNDLRITRGDRGEYRIFVRDCV